MYNFLHLFQLKDGKMGNKQWCAFTRKREEIIDRTGKKKKSKSKRVK